MARRRCCRVAATASRSRCASHAASTTTSSSSGAWVRAAAQNAADKGRSRSSAMTASDSAEVVLALLMRAMAPFHAEAPSSHANSMPAPLPGNAGRCSTARFTAPAGVACELKWASPWESSTTTRPPTVLRSDHSHSARSSASTHNNGVSGSAGGLQQVEASGGVTVHRPQQHGAAGFQGLALMRIEFEAVSVGLEGIAGRRHHLHEAEHRPAQLRQRGTGRGEATSGRVHLHAQQHRGAVDATAREQRGLRRRLLQLLLLCFTELLLLAARLHQQAERQHHQAACQEHPRGMAANAAEQRKRICASWKNQAPDEDGCRI